MDKEIDINQDIKTQNNMESQSVSVDKTADKKTAYSPVIKVKLTPDNEKAMFELIAAEETKIMAEYEEFDYFDKFGEPGDPRGGKYDREYDCSKDKYEDDGVSRRKLNDLTITADILAEKNFEQTITPSPICVMVLDENLEGKEYKEQDIRDREGRLDYALRNESGVVEYNYNSTRKAAVNGACIIKPCYEKNTEYITRKTIYTQKDIAKFEKLYGVPTEPNSKEYKNYAKLQAGERVEIIDVEPVVDFNGTRLKLVPLNNFYARLWKKDFKKHKAIIEICDDASWGDIESKVDESSPYGYNADAVNRLKEKISETGDTKVLNDFVGKIREAIVYIKLKSEMTEVDKPKERYQRYCIVYEDTHKVALRCIHYPYDHNKIFYIAKTAKPRANSWLGYSFAEILEDGESLAEGLLNSLINEFKIAENGVIMTNDKSTDFSRVVVKGGDGISIIPFKEGSTFQQMQFGFPHTERVPLINWLMNHNYQKTGLDPTIQSGGQTPDDPRAPLGKAQLKQFNSNARIKGAINNLQQADAEAFEQVDRNNYQYIYSLEEGDQIEYVNDEEVKTVNKNVYNARVRYVCNGSITPFNKEMDNQKAIQFIEWFKATYPQEFADADVQYAIAEIVANNVGGSIEQNKKIILKGLLTKVEKKKERMKLVNSLMKKGFDAEAIQMVLQMQDAGKSQKEIGIVLDKMQQQKEQAMNDSQGFIVPEPKDVPLPGQGQAQLPAQTAGVPEPTDVPLPNEVV